MDKITNAKFFVRGHATDIIQLVDENDRHIGVVTYRKLLYNHETIPVCEESFLIEESFWQRASDYFKKSPDDMVPIMDSQNNIISFCYNDTRRYYEFEVALKAFENADYIPVALQEIYPKMQQVCIMDINEFAYRLYRILDKYNVPVCVIGEKWGWFCIEPFNGYSDYPDFARLYIYAEGTGLTREEKEHIIPGYDDLQAFEGGFWTIVDWANKNTQYVIEEQSKRLTELGVCVCKVITQHMSNYHL